LSLCNKNRYLIQIYGIVQGVGFRPYIFRKAKEMHIYGWVNNTGAAVVIDAEGKREKLKQFVNDIVNNPPVLASIKNIDIRHLDPYGYEYFDILQSKEEKNELKFISPDIGVCDKCMEEVQNPSSGRYRYPFTNCTECGPRYSIIKALPYDRNNTAMKTFQQCSSCEEEYSNPESRRFHTQPNCCNACGPSLCLTDNLAERIECSDPIRKAAELIKEGKIIAIKGIGGFHLCCNAMNPETVLELRIRKNRPHKPLAIMAANINEVFKQCELSPKEQDIISSSKKPILLLSKKEQCTLPEVIAPNQKHLGVMLPYTPIHYLLFEQDIKLLVMTSGNIGGTPIEYENDEAFKNLKGIADYFLINNRDIYNPVDDSVVKVIAHKEMVSRRARGYIPFAQNFGASDGILAMGAEQKSTVCMSQNGYVYISQYLGDLKDMSAYELYKRIIENMTNIFQFNPKVFVHDLNPNYLSSGYAMQQQERRITVQHHHAHMASCMAEHNLFDKVIGVIFDGTGLGDDGSIWGGEFFIGDRRSFERVGHLKTVLLQGGDMAIIEPWRSAACYLLHMGYNPEDWIKSVDKSSIGIVKQALAINFNCHLSSSMGRLFDCAASIIGIRQKISYDAQAAIELENILNSSLNDTCYSYCIKESKNAFILDYSDIITDLLMDRQSVVPASIMSARFHNTISKASVDMLLRIRDKYHINTVVLSGGVFENTYLLESLFQTLESNSFVVYFNQQIPINDSGISIGQLVIANEIIRK